MLAVLIVRSSLQCPLWNAKGDLLIPCEYNLIFYRDNYFHVVKGEEQSSVKALFSKEGKCIIPIDEGFHDIIVMTKENASPYFLTEKKGKYGILSLSGEELIPNLYDNIFSKDNKFYTKNNNGKIVAIDDKRKESSSEDIDITALDLLMAFASVADFFKQKDEAEKCEDNGDLYRVAKNVKAVDYYRKAAELGRASAQNKLGICYQEGFGVEENISEAIKWYRKSAENGDLGGQSNLGYCYFEGIGVTQSYQEAIKLWRKAADQGDDYAQYYLGVCYENGYGVKQDCKVAADWYSKAAQQDNEEAIEALELLKNKNNK